MDYNNGKIYTIRSHQTDKFYIGSTCSTLTKRLSKHKWNYKRGILTSTSRDIVKYDDCYIELLEAYECKNKNELRKREGELIRQYKDMVVNCKIDGRTPKQYYIDNKEQLQLNNKHYRVDNKEKLQEYHKQYYKDNREKLIHEAKQYRIDNKEQIQIKNKHYYIDNKQVIQKYKKQYRIDNKEKIREHQNQKYNCVCGGKYTNVNKSRHLKSKKHQKFINQ